MYLRHITRRKDGKTHVYWQLVRSVRRGRRGVQETVTQVGELDAQGRARAQRLVRSISDDCCGDSQGQQFEGDEPIDAVLVKLGKVRLEHSRRFGASPDRSSLSALSGNVLQWLDVLSSLPIPKEISWPANASSW